MGCIGSKLDQEEVLRRKELKKKNKMIEKKIKRYQDPLKREIKLLLLGTGESGKSTFAKQMKILHQPHNGFDDSDLKRAIPVVNYNVVVGMQNIILAMKKFGIAYENDGNDEGNSAGLEKVGEDLLDVRPLALTGVLSQDIGTCIKDLWKDEGVQKAYERRAEYNLSDNVDYMFENIDRFCSEDYVPTLQDILRVRVKTTGIVETTFEIEEPKRGKISFRLVDVGGQRSERRKWIHCFENTDAILWVASLVEYDMTLFEDRTTNRMEEAIELFREIVNSKWFTKAEVILFLNKADIFQEKIQKVNLDVFWPDYEGELGDYKTACKFIGSKFSENVESKKLKDQDGLCHFFVHVTTATDTSNIKVVFETTRQAILQNLLRDMGMNLSI